LSTLQEKSTLVDGAVLSGRDSGSLAAEAPVRYRGPAGIEVAPDVWMREDGTGRALAVILSGLASLIFSAFVVIGLSEAGGDAFATVIAVELSFGLSAALFAAIAVRMARAGLRISAEGICLRGMVRTRRLSLAEVDEFVPGTFSSVPLRSEIGVKVRRREGRDLDIWAMGYGAPATEAGLEDGLAAMRPLCDELNRLLFSLRA